MLPTALKSRKYFSAIAVALLAGLNDALKLGLQPDTVMLIAGVMSAFILGESAIDAASAWGEKKAAASPPSSPASPSATSGT